MSLFKKKDEARSATVIPPWLSIKPFVLSDGRMGPGQVAMRAAAEAAIAFGGYIDGTLGVPPSVKADASLLIPISDMAGVAERTIRVMRHNVVGAEATLIFARDLRMARLDDVVRTCKERHRPFLLTADLYDVNAPLAVLIKEQVSRVYIDGYLPSATDDSILQQMLAKVFIAWRDDVNRRNGASS